MTEQVNAATELAREHAELDRLTARISALEAGPERDRLVRDISGLFLAHAEAEERRLYPALRNYLPGGWNEAAEQGRRQRAVARTIHAIERLPRPEGDEYDILVGHLVVGIEDHVERQDAVLLPSLVDACTIEEINRLGRRLGEAVEEALANERVRAAHRTVWRASRSSGISAVLRRLRGRS